jgi:hypothetical protein
MFFTFMRIVSGCSLNEQPTSTDTYTQDAQRNPSDFVKPIFLKDQDVHGSVKPPRTQWMTNAEIVCRHFFFVYIFTRFILNFCVLCTL